MLANCTVQTQRGRILHARACEHWKSGGRESVLGGYSTRLILCLKVFDVVLEPLLHYFTGSWKSVVSDLYFRSELSAPRHRD